MNTQRYLIAKFTKDVRRKEPRNVGVVLWTRHRVGCRFLPENYAAGIGADAKLYRRWTQFWSEACADESIDVGRGVHVPRTSPEFIDALIQTQRGQFRLTDAGYVRERIPAKDVDDVLARLYADLVAIDHDDSPPPKNVTATTLAAACRQLFDDAGLIGTRDFEYKKTSFIPCRIGKAARRFPINYRLGTEEHPTALYHRVNLSDEKSVDSASYMFEWLVASGRIADPARCGALFEPPQDAEPIAGARDQLSEHCVTIDVSDHRKALRRVQAVAYGPTMA